MADKSAFASGESLLIFNNLSTSVCPLSNNSEASVSSLLPSAVPAAA